MASGEADVELGPIPEGESEIGALRPAVSRSDCRVSVLNENGGGDDAGAAAKVAGSNSKQLRLRRAISDMRFKAKLAPVHPDKKVRSSASSSL